MWLSVWVRGCRLAYGPADIPLPHTVSCCNKIQIGFAFLVPAHAGSPEKGPLNGCLPTIYIYCLLVYRLLLHWSFFLHFFLSYLSFPLRIDPLHFQAGCRKMRLNLALVFLYLFCVVEHFFWLVNACFCCVRFSFFLYRQEIGLRKHLRNNLFCVEWDVKPRRCMSPVRSGIFQVTLPSVLWHCWLGGRNGIRPVKNWVVGCWCGSLSGARCRLAYGPADATATHCLLLQWSPHWFCLSGTGSPG